MPFTTIKPMMAEAEALLTASKYTEADELVGICAQALSFLAKEADAYCANIAYCRKFLPHFIEQLSCLVRFLESPASPETETFSPFGEVQARSFALVEDMALFVREKTLRNGAAAENPFEEKLLAYFESCGSWPGGTSEMVTDTYYNLLPVSVMKDMVTLPGKAPA